MVGKGIFIYIHLPRLQETTGVGASFCVIDIRWPGRVQSGVWSGLRVGPSPHVHLPVSPWPAVSTCHVGPGAGELWPHQAGITRAHGYSGKHMPACCSLPEHQPVVPHSLSGELNLVSSGDVPHCCPPSHSVCPGQGAARLSSGFSSGWRWDRKLSGQMEQGCCRQLSMLQGKLPRYCSFPSFSQNVLSILHMK